MRPRSQARAAMARVLKNLAAQSHLSIRTEGMVLFSYKSGFERLLLGRYFLRCRFLGRCLPSILGMECFPTGQHLNKFFNSVRPRLRLLGVVDPVKDRIAVHTVQRGEELFGARI